MGYPKINVKMSPGTPIKKKGRGRKVKFINSVMYASSTSPIVLEVFEDGKTIMYNANTGYCADICRAGHNLLRGGG